MAVWTTVPDSAQLPDQPIKSSEQIAIKNNITALAEGASGAPRIVNQAVQNGTLGAEKFQNGVDEKNWVLSRTSEASVGAVGTYAMLTTVALTTASPGTQFSASNLRYSNASGSIGGTVPAGSTWELMGQIFNATQETSTSFFLRVN